MPTPTLPTEEITMRCVLLVENASALVEERYIPTLGAVVPVGMKRAAVMSPVKLAAAPPSVPVSWHRMAKFQFKLRCRRLARAAPKCAPS